ncbi:unnamed protein product [Lactuca virosa]|uniref:Uncharacterized protein n=1 Tax=Lactuca virosa TaxID=75947 RepID=A0AAU9LXU5_9ASTR|nr:unnamed protein product [Lactuca virosa]
MNEHPAPRLPPPPRIVVLRTTTDILKQIISIFFNPNNLQMLLFLSLLVLSIRVNVEMTTHSLTSFIDNDPSIKPLIYRIHGPPNTTSPTSNITTRRRRFPQLTRVRTRTLDDDSFPGDYEFDHRCFGSSLLKPQSNATSFILDTFDPQFGFSDSVSDNGIRASETVRSTAKMTFTLIEIIEKEENVVIHRSNDSAPLNEMAESESEFQFFLKRLSPFILMRWAIRDALTHLLGFCFFVSIKDQYSFLKIFLRYKFMPFSIMSPWVKGYEKEIYWFLKSWIILDLFMSYAFAVVAWIVMAGSRRSWREIVKEGYHLLSLRLQPAVNLMFFEVVVCGRYVRWVISQHFGVFFAVALQSFMEVYFMVAWMMYYLSVKSIDANSSGQPFGKPELEAMLEDVK